MYCHGLLLWPWPRTKAQAGSNIKGDLRRIGCLSSARSQTVLRSLTYCSQVSQYSLPSDETLDSDPFVDILSISPFLAAVYDGLTYGLVSCTQAAARKFKCSHCHSHPTCDHISFLQDWCDINNLSDDLFPQVFHSSQELEPYKSISYIRIPYPLPDDLKKVHDALESGEQCYPMHLIPDHNSGMCSHGHK